MATMRDWRVIPNQAPIRLLLDGTAVYYAPQFRYLKTTEAIRHPRTRLLSPLYNTLAEVEAAGLTSGMEVSIATPAIPSGFLRENNAVVVNITQRQELQQVRPSPQTVPVVIWLIVGLILLITFVAAAGYFLVKVTNSFRTPTCRREITDISDRVALVISPDCSSATVDKETGQLIDQIAGPPQTSSSQLLTAVAFAAIGIGVMYVLFKVGPGLGRRAVRPNGGHPA